MKKIKMINLIDACYQDEHYLGDSWPLHNILQLADVV